MRRRATELFLSLAVGAAFLSTPAAASNKYLEVPPASVVRASPAYRYANLTNEQAYAELDRRGVGYELAEPPTGGVRAPMRLTGRLHDVWIHSSLPAAKRRESPFEILDARLALALDDFCGILAHHNVVEVVHFTMYRPSPELRADSHGKRFRHAGGLAIDVGALRKRNGEWLRVGPDWSSSVGAKTCGAGARHLHDAKGRELQSILCEAADERLFTYMLTPHFNKAHADHMHLEVKPGVKWFLVN